MSLDSSIPVYIMSSSIMVYNNGLLKAGIIDDFIWSGFT